MADVFAPNTRVVVWSKTASLEEVLDRVVHQCRRPMEGEEMVSQRFVRHV